MKTHYFFPQTQWLCRLVLFSVITLFSIAHVSAQTFPLPKADKKKQKIILMYRMDHFFIDPAILMNELIWENKFRQENNYADEIKYLRMAYEKLEFTYGQKEFRNQSEDKIYQVLQKMIVRMICDGKVSHFDRHTKKAGVAMKMDICKEKDASYATVTTPKGKVIFDCEGRYLPQLK